MTGFGTNNQNNLTTPNPPALSARQSYLGNSAVPQSTTPTPPNTTTVIGSAPLLPSGQPSTASSTTNQPSTAQLNQLTMNILQNLGGLQNPLNSYFQVQPIFKLFMTQDADPFAASGSGGAGGTGATTVSAPQIYSAIQNMKSVTLAQTGVTGYNIRSVEIDAQVGGPTTYGIMTNATEFTIVVSEAMGIGFPESMLAAAQYLGVKNYLKTYIYLQLQFIAYDEAGNIVLDPVSPGLSIPNIWIWQLNINDIDVHLDAGGGTYTIKAQNFNELCYDPAIFNIPEANTVSGGTLGAITTSLANVLNQSWYDRNGNYVTKYAFQWHKLSETLHGNFAAPDDPSTYPTSFTAAEFNSLEGVEYNGTNTAFVFHNAIDIPTFLNAVIKNTKNMQALGIDDATTGSTPLGQHGFRKSIHWMIEPDVKYTGQFETYTQQYYKIITFHIRPYYTQRIIIDPKQAQDAAQPGVSLQAMTDKVKQTLLKKRYDYIYTGLNIDVIDFDIHYNYQWQAILSRFAGKLTNTEQVAPHSRVDQSTLTNPSGPAGPQAQQQTPSNQVSTDVLASNFTTAQYQQEQDQQSLTDLQAQNGSADQISAAQKNLTQSTAAVNAARTAYSQRIQQTTTSVQVQSNNGSKVYAEALINTPQAVTTSTPNNIPSNNLPIPIAHADKFIDDQGGTGARQDTSIDKSVFEAVTGQLTAPLSYQFQQINLVIRGDPFWLGQTNIIRIDNMRNNTKPPQNTPDFFVGDNCFLLHFRAPIAMGDDFAPVFKDSIVFNGLYSAIRVKSIFGGNDGFKQELTGLRLPLIDIAKAATGQGATGTNTPVSDANNNPAPGSTGATANPNPGSTGAGTDWYNSPPAAQYKDTIDAAAAKYGVPPQLLAWQIGQESSFNASPPTNGSTSSGVPVGIAQFTTGPNGTANNVPGYGSLDPTDPNASIMAAAAYDQHLYNQTGSWQGALTKYGTLSGNPAQSTWNGFNNAIQQSGLPPGS